MTGLGFNTAIEDAFNLSWKLAMIFNHQADPKILDTYELERRPIGQRNTDWGLFTFENSAVINSALGLIAGQKERNRARFEAVFADNLTGRSLHAQVKKMIDSQSIEFGAHGVELGFVYENGALISDGTETPLRYLNAADWRILTAVETGSRNHEFVPVATIASLAGYRNGSPGDIQRSISTLAKTGLIDLGGSKGRGKAASESYQWGAVVWKGLSREGRRA